MKPIELGEFYEGEVWAKASDLASALGNTGVDVVSSPATIGFLEMACHQLIDPKFENDEASVGVGFNLQHLAAAYVEKPIALRAELIAMDARKFTFKVEARQDDRVIMNGEHVRAVINLGRFLQSRDAAS